MAYHDQTYSELVNLKQRLEDKNQSLSRQLLEVQHQLKSVLTTLELLGRKDTPEPEANLIFPPEQVRGLTQHQALERIAKANNGRFKLVDAKKVLVAAGLVTTPKNAYSILAGAIRRGAKFRKVGPGEYELIGWEKRTLIMSGGA
jgi:hypothetical protein